MSVAATNAVPARVEEIFAAVRPRLAHVLAHFRIPVADAEDLVQEAVVQFLRKREQIYQPEQWLVGAVRKECLMYWRRHRRRLEVALDVAVAGATEDAPQERQALRGDLDRAINTLRPKCRSLLRLRYALGLSTEETATQLGYSLASLDNIARRCLAALSQRLLSCTLAVRTRC
jgi:RNA polymerase sigma factor (sigma-70 family)